jgi:hypothetical protein
MNLSNILAALGGIGSLIGIFGFLRKQPKYRVLYFFIIIVGSLVLVYFLPQNNSTYSNSTKNDNTSQNDSSGKHANLEKNKSSLTNSISKVKVSANDDSISYKKERVELIDMINKSEKADFAVLAITDGKNDTKLAAVFVEWLKKYGSASYSILLNSFAESGFFDKILDGNSSEIVRTNISKAVKYICLVRSSIDYKGSVIDGLIFANCSYDVMIVETSSGKIVDILVNPPVSSSDISEKKAKERSETLLYDFLSKRKLTL